MRLTRIRRVAIIEMEIWGLEIEGFVQVMIVKKKKKKKKKNRFSNGDHMETPFYY